MFFFNNGDIFRVDFKGGMVWLCFVDMYIYLDKGYIWEWLFNLDGSFNGVLDVGVRDGEKYWNVEDIYCWMEFGFKCSYVYGIKVIWIYIDCFGE